MTTHYWRLHTLTGAKQHVAWKSHLGEYTPHCNCCSDYLAKLKLLNKWNGIGNGKWVYWM